MTAEILYTSLHLSIPELMLAVGAMVLLMIGVFSGERSVTLVTGLAVALLIVAGLWLDVPVRLAAGVVVVLMVGALVMHLKVGDPAKRSVPAALMLLMCGAILLLG